MDRLNLINKQDVTFFVLFFLLPKLEITLFSSALQSDLATDQFVHVVIA